MEELLLGLHLALQELDVVDQQDVDVPVAALEGAGLVVSDAVDEVVGELLGVHVADPDPGIEVLRVVPDGVQQVGLAEPGLAVDEERVVGLGRRLGDGDRRGMGESVAGPDHERLEGVLRVQPGRLSLGPGRRPVSHRSVIGVTGATGRPGARVPLASLTSVGVIPVRTDVERRVGGVFALCTLRLRTGAGRSLISRGAACSALAAVSALAARSAVSTRSPRWARIHALEVTDVDHSVTGRGAVD